MSRSTPPQDPSPPRPRSTAQKRAVERGRTNLPRVRWLLLILPVIALFTLIVGVSAALMAFAPTPITVVIDGDAHAITTRARTVGAFLEQNGVTVALGDRLTPDASQPIAPNLLIRLDRARPVTLTIDGTPQTIYTAIDDPAALLVDAGIVLQPGDRLVIDGTDARAADLAGWRVPVEQISVQRARSFTIEADGVPQTLDSTAATLGEALFDAGITLYLADVVSAPLDAPIEPGATVTLRRAPPITIEADGETIAARVEGETVADALAAVGVALVGLDYAVPDETTPLTPTLAIRVVRVREELLIEETAIPFGAIVEGDAALELDQTIVAQAGREGIERTSIRVRYENGVETTRAVESIGVARAPQPRIVRYGTQIVLRDIETPDGTRQYWRRLRVFATSYHPAALGGDNITATGRVLQRGIVGADIRLLPYDTTIYVPSYGVGVIADTGARRRDPYWIDLGYSDADWRSWSRMVDVYLLTPVPESIDYQLP